jgi:23S rRNA (cytidine1920-2'-O)/16S rRNA (cytidine1409-2'-O)-methyltransferase
LKSAISLNTLLALKRSTRNYKNPLNQSITCKDFGRDIMKTRLDAELVRRELARSREHAADLIESRSVLVNGIPATKPASQVDAETSIVLQGDRDDFVSRGGHKLAGALDIFTGVQVEGRTCLDAGASTGGFTDVLLRRGAKLVVAVDVGYGQLAWELRQDERVKILDRTNIRHLTGDQVSEDIDLVVADLSFISLSLVLPALAAVSRPDADFVLMVKPQFEVGREKLGAGGVVRDPALRRSAVLDVAESAYDVGLGTLGIAASPLPGPAGNVEYFLWLRRGAPEIDESALDAAIAAGPE